MHENLSPHVYLYHFYQKLSELHTASSEFITDLPKPDYPIQATWLMNFAATLLEHYHSQPDPTVYQLYQTLAEETAQFHLNTQGVFLNTETYFRLLTQTYHTLRTLGERLEKTMYQEVQETETLGSMILNEGQTFQSTEIPPLKSLYQVTALARLNLIFIDMIEEETLSTLNADQLDPTLRQSFLKKLNLFLTYSDEQIQTILEQSTLTHPLGQAIKQDFQKIYPFFKILQTEYFETVQDYLKPTELDPSPLLSKKTDFQKK